MASNPVTSAFDALRQSLSGIAGAGQSATQAMKDLKNILDSMNKVAGGTSSSSTSNVSGGITITTMSINSVNTINITGVQNIAGLTGTGTSTPSGTPSAQSTAPGAPTQTQSQSSNPSQSTGSTKSPNKNSMAAVFGENWMLIQATEKGIQYLGQIGSAGIDTQQQVYNQMLSNSAMTEQSIQALHMRGYGQIGAGISSSGGGIAGSLIGGIIGQLAIPVPGVGFAAGATIGGTIGSSIGGTYGSEYNSSMQQGANLLDVQGNRNLINYRLQQAGIGGLGGVNIREPSTYLGSSFLGHYKSTIMGNPFLLGANPMLGVYQAYDSMVKDNEKFATDVKDAEFSNQMGQYKLQSGGLYAGGSKIDIDSRWDVGGSGGSTHAYRRDNAQQKVFVEQQLAMSSLVASGIDPQLLLSKDSPKELIDSLKNNPNRIRAYAAAGISLETFHQIGIKGNDDDILKETYKIKQYGINVGYLSGQTSQATGRMGEAFARGVSYQELPGIANSARSAMSTEAATMERRAADLEATGLDVNIAQASQLRGQAQQLKAQNQQIAKQVTMYTISEQDSIQGFNVSTAESSLTKIRYGFGSSNLVNSTSLGKQLDAFGNVSGELMRSAAMKRQQSEMPNLSPGERAKLKQEANELDIQARMATREGFQQDFNAKIAAIGSLQANVEGNITIQSMMGNATDVRGAMLGRNEYFNQQISTIQGRISQGNLTGEELGQLQEKLAKVMNDMKINAEQAVLAFHNITIAVAGSSTAITTSNVNTALLRGGGGAGMVGSIYGITQGIQGQISAVDDEIRDLKSRGYKDDNPLIKELEAKRAAFGSQIAQNENMLANTPMSANFRREQSRLNFESSFFSIMPAGYGNVMNIARGQMGMANREIDETQKIRQEIISKQGYITDSQELTLQERMQGASMKYAEAYNKLSFGWQDRLVSTVINAPGSFAMVSNRAAWFHAVGAGVKNPFFGFGSGKESLDAAQGSMFADPLNSMSSVGFTSGALSGNRQNTRSESSGILRRGDSPTNVVVTLNATPELARLLQIGVASQNGGTTSDSNNPGAMAEIMSTLGLIGGMEKSK